MPPRSHLVTLLERHRRNLLVRPLPGARSSVIAALGNALTQLPQGMAHTLKLGPEFSAATGVPVNFCDAYCPWPARQEREHERGPYARTSQGRPTAR